MLLPDPPCCRVKQAASCNESGLCNKVGQFGFSYFHVNRAWIFITLALASFTVTIVSIIPIVSMSHTNDDVKNTYWTKGEYGDTEFFVGLEKVVFIVDGSEQSFLWSDDECDMLLSSGADACDECEAACNRVVIVVAMNIIIIAVTIASNTKRSTASGDLNCTKFMAIFSGIVSSIIMLSSLSIFSDGCYYNLPENTESGDSVSYSHGPSFVCIVVPQLFKIFEAIIHVVTPVPPRILNTNADLKQLFLPRDGHAPDNL